MGVDPRFDATNAAHRVLCTLNLEVLDLSPQLLGYFELHRSKLGANATRSIGDAVVTYVEWAAGPEQDLIARAAAFGRQTGTLPPSVPTLPATDTGTSLRNDVAAGFSWTVATAVTFNAEYHFHEAGFTRRDWKNWFDLGSAPGAPAPFKTWRALVPARIPRQRSAGAGVEPADVRPRLVAASRFTPDLELRRVRLHQPPPRRLGAESALRQLPCVGRVDGFGLSIGERRRFPLGARQLPAERQCHPPADAALPC